MIVFNDFASSLDFFPSINFNKQEEFEWVGVLFVLRLEINIKQDELYGGFIVGGAHLRVQGDVYKLCPTSQLI